MEMLAKGFLNRLSFVSSGCCLQMRHEMVRQGGGIEEEYVDSGQLMLSLRF